MIGNLNHVAIAVPDLDAAVSQYQNVFGAFVTSPVDLPSHGIRMAIVKLLNTKIELITPLGESSPIQNFLGKHPQGGIHHLCYEVSDILKARDQLISNGIQVIGDGTPQEGYRGNPVLFFNPKDALGTLIELEETKAAQTQGRVEIGRISGGHGYHTQEPNSLEGVDGIGIRVEVDYKTKTPKDNMEDN